LSCDVEEFKTVGNVTTLYRIMKHLGKNSGKLNAKSVTIMATQKITGLDIRYKHVDYPADWKDGGKSESGQYRVNDGFKGAKVPKDSELRWSWHRMHARNCQIIPI
jgi:hypothetical protein